MSGLTLCTGGSAEAGRRVLDIIADIFDDNKPQTAPPKIGPLLEARRGKINRVRQQLAHGTYDLDERLDAILDRILTEVTP